MCIRDRGYTDDSGFYITYEADSLRGLQYAYINKSGNTVEQAICFVFNWDYEPLAVQFDSKLYLVDTASKKLTLVKSTKENTQECLRFSLKQNTKGRVVVTSRPKQVASGIGTVLSIPDFLDLAQNLAQQDFGTFFQSVAAKMCIRDR